MSYVKVFFIVALLVSGFIAYKNPEEAKQFVKDSPGAIKELVGKIVFDEEDSSDVPSDEEGEIIDDSIDLTRVYYGKPQRLFDCELDEDCFSVDNCDDSCFCDISEGECYRLE